MDVGGIGAGGASTCNELFKIPIGIENTDGMREHGVYTSPEIPKSDVPGIWGLKGMQRRRVLIDTGSLSVIIPGEAGFTIELSPGSQVLRCTMSRSGHMLIPCTHYKGAKDVNGTMGPPRNPRSWMTYGGLPQGGAERLQ